MTLFVFYVIGGSECVDLKVQPDSSVDHGEMDLHTFYQNGYFFVFDILDERFDLNKEFCRYNKLSNRKWVMAS